MGISSNGNGNVSVKFVEPNIVRITAGNETVADFKPTGVELSKDLSAPGGHHHVLTFSKYSLIQGQSTAMTASLIQQINVSGSLVSNVLAQKGVVMVRPGSIVGISLNSENGTASTVFLSGALTASVTLDGANTSFQLVATPSGSRFVTTQAKDTTAFSASQLIGVSLTASAGYGSDQLSGVSASWVASVVVEF